MGAEGAASENRETKSSQQLGEVGGHPWLTDREVQRG